MTTAPEAAGAAVVVVVVVVTKVTLATDRVTTSPVAARLLWILVFRVLPMVVPPSKVATVLAVTADANGMVMV